MDASAGAPDADDRANELYWGSAMSVNQIADALDLSKGALYELIRPLAAADTCPSCGSATVHSNRTAKERGLVCCQVCGWEGARGTPAFAVQGAARGSATPSPLRRQAPGTGSSEGEVGSLPPGRRKLAAGMLLGAAAGLALFLWFRRK